MPEFVIEREIPGAGRLSEAEIRDMSLHSLQVLKEIGPQIQWLHSYVTEDKVYCVYLAPDENSIREHARRAGIPADRVSAVRRLIDPSGLNQESAGTPRAGEPKNIG
jgi:rRNA-processing protein FCF1